MSKNKLIWNVYIQSFNNNQITIYNIFDYSDLEKQFKKLKKKYIDNKATFLEEVDRRLQSN